MANWAEIRRSVASVGADPDQGDRRWQFIAAGDSGSRGRTRRRRCRLVFAAAAVVIPPECAEPYHGDTLSPGYQQLGGSYS